MWERTRCSCRTELVWDGERRATGLTPEGAAAVVGPAESWRPEQLLAMAVDAATMMEFLALADAERLEVLGYVSSARVTPGRRADDGALIVLAPCIVVAGADGVETAMRLLERALASSLVGRSLRVLPGLEPEIVAAPLAATV